MKVARTVPALRDFVAQAPRPLGLVPTMGALHAGHLSLVEAARECASVVVSIFVNPLQFAPTEDFDAYPRDVDADIARLDGVDAVFLPETASFTPADLSTTVHVSGLAERLEGTSRPGHFDGVATIVVKLLNAVGPDRAYFGMKDYQQLAVIRRLVTDLDMGTAIVGCPIVRDEDGLALSSRNAYLSADERAQALEISRALFTTQRQWTGDADAARTRLRTMLEAAPGLRLDYAEIADPDTLAPLHGSVAGSAQALVAAFVGPTRLIDNVRLER